MSTVTQCFQFDDVEVRPASFEVLKAGRTLSLEPKAIRVLVYLIDNRHRAVSKDELLKEVWQGAAVTDNALTRIVAQLRRELKDDARNPRYIQTLPTLGYRFIVDLAAESTSPPPEAPPPRFARRWIIATGCAFASLVLVAPFVSRSPSGSHRIRTTGLVQVTTSPGLDVGVSFSPDGKSIVYSSDRTGRFEVYVRGIAPDSRDTLITADGKQNMQPAWSPDGKWVAFYSVVRNGICLVRPSGGEVRQITTFGSSPAWSPDSSRIAFRSTGINSVAVRDLAGNGLATIWEVPASGGAPRQLTRSQDTPGVHLFPAWSPDGRRVVFVSASEVRGAELHTVDRTNGATRKLWASPAGIVLTPLFSPDGRYLYYTEYSPEREFGLWRVAIDPQTGDKKGEPAQIAATGASMPRDAALSRDGKRVAFTYSTATSQLWSIPTTGGSPKPLYREAVSRAIHPAFSPDGSRVAYVSRRFGSKADLWMMRSDGTDPQPVSTESGLEFLPSWSYDSRFIFFELHRVHGAIELWRYAVANGERKKLWNSTEPISWTRISGSGKEFVYHSGEPLNISRHNIETGIRTQLTFDKEGAAYPSVSPDERWIAYEKLRGEHSYLALVDRDGRQERDLIAEPGHAWVHGWSPDSRRILYAGFRDGAWNIYWVDRTTGERRKLTDITSMDGYVRYPAWSPNDDVIVFELATTRGNIYVADLEN